MKIIRQKMNTGHYALNAKSILLNSTVENQCQNLQSIMDYAHNAERKTNE